MGRFPGVGSGDGTLDHTLGAREIAESPYDPCASVLRFFHQGKITDECGVVHFWSMHPGGGHFGFLDGSVRFYAYDASSIMISLATRNGSEVVGN